MEISTSILSIKENQDKKEIYYLLEKGKTDYIHIDIMDGKFVEKNTIEIMKENMFNINNLINLPLDVHLMVENIKENIDIVLDYNPKQITFHLENLTEEEILKNIDYIKLNNCKVGIAIKPNTRISELEKFLPYIHTVLIMTVEPGYGGQKLIRETLLKIKDLKDFLQQKNLFVEIEVDGGVNLENIKEIKELGVDVAVIGSAIINSENIIEKLYEFRKI